MKEPRGDTKHQILANALRLFSRHGYDGTSIRQLTGALGITPAALYYHFNSKQHLLEALAKGFIHDSDLLLDKLRGTENEPDGTKVALEGLYDLLSQHLTVFRLIFNDAAIQGSSVGTVLRQQTREFFEFLMGNEPTTEDRLRMAGAVGVIRLSLEQPGVDPAEHRAVILARANRLLAD